MDFSKYVAEYNILLKELSKTRFFGRCAVTHFLSNKILKSTGIGDFYLKNKLSYKDKLVPGKYIDVPGEEHPVICGGVTEYMTKIRLARQIGADIERLDFFGNINDKKYAGLNDDELAFAMYEPDLQYRSGYTYDSNIMACKDKIIQKASILADIALKLINDTFKYIKSDDVDFHPNGHVFYDKKLAIYGDGDLAINNCIIDFKTRKNYMIQTSDRGQIFAYCLHKYMRDGENYSKAYFINPRFSLIGELVIS